MIYDFRVKLLFPRFEGLINGYQIMKIEYLSKDSEFYENSKQNHVTVRNILKLIWIA